MRVTTTIAVALTAAFIPIRWTSAQRVSSSENIATLLFDPAPGTSVSDWRSRTPAATWQRYRGTYEQIGESLEETARGVEPSGFWCAVATDHQNNLERVAVFFALRDTPPAACRIELVQGVARRSTEQQASTLFRDLTEALTQKLGGAPRTIDRIGRDIPYPYGGGTGLPEGVTDWTEGLAWHDEQRDVFLFRAARAVGFASRSSLLTRETEDEGEPINVGKEAERRLADALRKRFPTAAAAMPFEFVPEHQPEIRRALIEILDARSQATEEDQPLLAFAADRLARKLWVDPPIPSKHQELAPLLRRGLRFVREPYNDLWVYDGALVNVVLRRWPETAWGQLAFAAHLYAGWTEGTCDGNAYAGVIRHGDAWLRSHTESPWRTNVMTAVARAYETRWALNGSFTADARENARLVTAAQATARRNAIRMYEDVMRAAPNSQDSAYARRRIVQLRANMTTSQYAYSCVYP
jgi:hypothetical protein